LHPYNYGLNNPILYTDPSGEIVPVILAGAAIGAAFGGIGYVVTHPGEDYFHSRGFWTSVGIGALSGAVGGGIGGWVAGAGILGGGFWAAVAGGAAGGAAAGATGQIAANLLDPCADWHEGVAEAAVQGAVIGRVTGGIGYGLKAGGFTKGTTLSSKPTGGWRIRALRLRHGPWGPSYEVFNWRGTMRIEAHPTASWMPRWLYYPHMHLDFLGYSISKIHIPIVEPIAIGYVAAKISSKK
jgi:hypothetical protein